MNDNNLIHFGDLYISVNFPASLIFVTAELVINKHTTKTFNFDLPTQV
jgi:hypothetical protein